MSPDHPAHLNYSNRPLIWHQKRSIRRILLISCILMALGLAWWAWESSPGEWARFTYWNYRCNHHSPPTEIPAYSTDPAVQPKMLAGGTDHYAAIDRSDVCYIPNEWLRIQHYRVPEKFVAYGLVFLHQRTRPSGGERLISIEIATPARHPSFPYATSTGSGIPAGQKVCFTCLEPLVFMTSGGSHLMPIGRSDLTTMVLPAAEQLSLFDGQPDPIDPSRFTIPYKLKGQAGTIEGRLKDDNTVILQVLDGPLVLFEKDFPYVPRPRVSLPSTNAKNAAKKD
jgi:hypothetical protein